MKINTNFACDVVSITKVSNMDATKAYIQDSSFVNLTNGTADFVGDVATFSPKPALSDATDYWFMVDDDGASYSNKFSGEISGYPEADTNFDWTKGKTNTGETTTRWLGVISAVTSRGSDPANKFIQTNALSITADPVAVQLFETSTVAGSGSVDFDFKIGSGSFQTGKAYGSKITNTDTGNTITIKHHLKGTGSGNTAEATDYVLFLYY